MPSKLGFTFDPFALVGMDPPQGRIEEAKRAIADLVLEEVLVKIGQGTSPISGGKWKRSLSPEYRDRKLAISGVGFANMELHGDMLDALECVPVRGGIELRVRGSKQAAKADGHNNHSGKSSLPPRQFIPMPGQTFKGDILALIRDTIREFREPPEG